MALPFFFLLIVQTPLGCRGQSTPPQELVDGNPLSKRLKDLTFDSMVRLGSHRMTGTMVAQSEGVSRNFSSTEVYDLKWEGQQRFAYDIRKDERPTMNVIVMGNKAFQVRPDGLGIPRSNIHDFHYYLQQTWNLWATAITPFGDSITLTHIGEELKSGRQTDKYAVGLKTSVAALGKNSSGRVETRLLSATGILEVDRSTSVPIVVNFEGSYKTIRFSRVPGRVNPSTTHTITLDLERNAIGQAQQISPPTLAPVTQNHFGSRKKPSPLKPTKAKR